MASNGTEVQLNPPLQATSIVQTPQVDSYANHHLYNYSNPSYSLHYSQLQNPNPFPDHHYFANSVGAVQIQPAPPGFDPVPPVAVNPPANSYVSPPGYDASQLGLAYSSSQAAGLYYAAYQDPNQNVALTSCGVNLYGAGVIATPTGIQNLAASQIIGSIKSNTSTKKGTKKIKIVQSVWCEVCRVDCNSKNVLDQHKLGKKHERNLKKLINANKSVLVRAPAPTPSSVSASAPTASMVSANPLIGPQENPGSNPPIGPQENPVKTNCASTQIEQNTATCTDELETKKKRVLEGGAAANAVRMCAICNVVCNSEAVFRSHLAGQKHASKVKKHANATRFAA